MGARCVLARSVSALGELRRLHLQLTGFTGKEANAADRERLLRSLRGMPYLSRGDVNAIEENMQRPVG